MREARAEVRVEEFPEGTPTAKAAASAVGCELGQIVKSLVFDCEGRKVLALVPGDRRADSGKVARAAGTTFARIAGSDIAHAVPLTLIAGIGHWVMGSVDFGLMLALLAGSIPGIIVGSLFGSRASDAWLRPVLAVTLLVVSVKLLAN